MGLIREPKGVDFFVINRELTPEERAEVSAYIAKEKLRMAKLKKRREAREAKKAAATSAGSSHPMPS